MVLSHPPVMSTSHRNCYLAGHLYVKSTATTVTPQGGGAYAVRTYRARLPPSLFSYVPARLFYLRSVPKAKSKPLFDSRRSLV